MRKTYRKVYIVLGGESTGTRMVTDLMVKGGCWGDAGHHQKMDDFVREGNWSYIKKLTESIPIVWRRSFPHDKHFIDIYEELVFPLIKNCGFEGRDIFFLVMVRDWFCASRSASIMGHSDTPVEAIDKLKEAYARMFSFFSAFSSFDYYMVSYEGIIKWAAYAVPVLFRQVGLSVPINKMPNMIKSIVDNNYKHFHGFSRDAWLKEVDKNEQ